jgi:hypothetical protein
LVLNEARGIAGRSSPPSQTERPSSVASRFGDDGAVSGVNPTRFFPLFCFKARVISSECRLSLPDEGGLESMDSESKSNLMNSEEYQGGNVCLQLETKASYMELISNKHSGFWSTNDSKEDS